MKCGHQAHVVEHGRTEFHSQGTRFGQATVDQFTRLGDDLAQDRVGDSPIERGKFELGGGEQLLQVVVEDLGHPAPFALFRAAEF